jgi:hypothetical protein
MADKKIKLEPDDWLADGYVIDHGVAMEYVREILDDVRKRLMAGAEGAGATLTLTADECVKVLYSMKNPPNHNSRPRQGGFEKQAASDEIALYCRDLEKAEPLKSAVAMTAKHFGCSTSKVYGARKALSWPYK